MCGMNTQSVVLDYISPPLLQKCTVFDVNKYICYRRGKVLSKTVGSSFWAYNFDHSHMVSISAHQY